MVPTHQLHVRRENTQLLVRRHVPHVKMALSAQLDELQTGINVQLELTHMVMSDANCVNQANIAQMEQQLLSLTVTLQQVSTVLEVLLHAQPVLLMLSVLATLTWIVPRDGTSNQPQKHVKYVQQATTVWEPLK